ncbi:hypothetical protein HAL07_15850 [Helicobacter ailurogastricus]|uniref:Uncharacterized protein n=1 Tax=Helicobacter ailurogastricus TaxID=1578720 RepID=A0A0K2Y7J8_9HELI|nr:hypothetical protein HAL07_15850 [Helicobacter ailurogastricus]
MVANPKIPKVVVSRTTIKTLKTSISSLMRSLRLNTQSFDWGKGSIVRLVWIKK